MRNEKTKPQCLNVKMKKPENIQKRSEQFAIKVLTICRMVQKDVITLPLIRQVVRSSTSIGANLHETKFAYSKKEFLQKTTIALKEANETRYWLKLIRSNGRLTNDQKIEIENTVSECSEIIAILTTITRKVKMSVKK